MSSIRGGVPPIRCSAHSKRTGELCRRYAKPGTTTCASHWGASPQAVAKAEVRMTLAQLLGQDPRTPWEVVLDATHTADVLMRDTKAKLLVGENVTVEQVDRLLELTTYAHKLASVAIQTGAAERVAQTYERNRQLEGEIIATPIVVVLDGVDRYLAGLGLDAGQVITLRSWAVEAAAATLEDGDVPALPPVPGKAVRVLKHDPGDDHQDDARGRDEAARPGQHGLASSLDDDHDHDHHRDDDHDGDPPEVLDRPGVAELVRYRRSRGDEPG
jgi:hypothetical protein